jgi:hypothetical protein
MKKTKTTKSRHKRLQSIKCECGTEILLLPDAKAMSKAIDTHIAQHCKNLTEPTLAKAETERLWELIVSRLFIETSYPAKAAC